VTAHEDSRGSNAPDSATPAGDSVEPSHERIERSGLDSAGIRLIDSRLPRFNQAVLSIVILVSFVTKFFWTIPLWALFLLGGVVAGPKGNPIQALFAYVIKPRLRPPRSMEDPRPPRFAASLGFAFLVGSTAAYLGGLEVIAWGLALLVAALAAVAAIFNICVGCEVYVAIMRARGRLNGPWRIERAVHLQGNSSDRAAGTLSG
jgi:hypothetical protein